MACDLILPEEGTPFIDVYDSGEDGFAIDLSNRKRNADLLKKTLSRIGLADKEITSNFCSVLLEVVPRSEANAVPERVKHWIERLSSGLDGSSCSLMVDYPGICEVVYEGGRIKAKSHIADWKEEDMRLDDIAAELSRLAEVRSLALNTSGDCLVSYDCDEEAATAGPLRTCPK